MGKMVLVATVKQRLGVLVSDTQYDELLGWMIEAVGSRFESECDRVFQRVVDHTVEFEGTALFVTARAMPVERVTKFELWTPGDSGWVEVAGVDYVVRSQAVVSLAVPLGTSEQRARMTYTGGYVYPGDVVGEGQTALAGALVTACAEQTAFWFQQRDKTGRVTSGVSGGNYDTVRDVDLLPGVRAVLRRYRRWVV